MSSDHFQVLETFPSRCPTLLPYPSAGKISRAPTTSTLKYYFLWVNATVKFCHFTYDQYFRGATHLAGHNQHLALWGIQRELRHLSSQFS